MPTKNPILLKPKAAAEVLGYSDSWMAKARGGGYGPAFIKTASGGVSYLRAEIDRWVAEQPLCASTSEYKTSAGH